MPYIRKKLRKGIEYFYLVHCERVSGKVKQQVLCYLGKHKTVAAAYRYWQRQAKTATDVTGKSKAREMIQKLKPFI